MQKIVIDEEFKSLIPPLTDEERAGLEESIIREGCRDALVLWGDVLVDGHNRYEICTAHDIPFQTVQKDFKDRNAVIVWMVQNQLGRRNLLPYVRAELALRLKPVIAEKAKENQGTRTDILLNSAKCSPINTAKIIAKAAGVGRDTIQKVEKIEKEATPWMKEQLRAGEMSINQAYNRIKDDRQLIKPHVAYNSGNNEWYTPAEIIEAAREVMGSIDLDPASSDIANEVVKAGTYYTAKNSGLDKAWFGNVWLNPPYAAELIGKFADALVEKRTDYEQAIVLVNNATETKWFAALVDIASAIVFPTSRVKFYMPDKRTGAPLQGQAILYIGDNANKFLKVFMRFGWGVTTWRI